YRAVRAQDRIVLRGLRDRAVAWGRHDRSSQEGLRLLGDIATCADLLRAINRRQELRSHDEALLRALAGEPGGGDDWWGRVQRLEGLDEALDLLLGRARAAADRGALLALVQARLDALRSAAAAD